MDEEYKTLERSRVLMFAGVTAAAPCSTPSVVRKLSRVLAASGENSTTKGRPLSGHLTTTALDAFTFPTKTPETYREELKQHFWRRQATKKVPVFLICA